LFIALPKILEQCLQTAASALTSSAQLGHCFTFPLRNALASVFSPMGETTKTIMKAINGEIISARKK